MPDRHFYLLRHHILFYIKFLLFCSLAPDEIKILCGKNKGVVQKSKIFIQIKSCRISIFANCGFRIVRKKKKYHIPDAASEHV